MKTLALALMLLLIAGWSFASSWRAIEKIEVEVFTDEKTAWTLEYSLGRDVHRKIGATGRRAVTLDIGDLPRRGSEIVCAVRVETEPFPAKDPLVGVAIRIFRRGNTIEAVNGPACRTGEYTLEYRFKKYR